MVSSPAAGNGRFILHLLPQVTCPHCWHVFAPEQALYIAAHPELTGDPRLGEEHPQRFLPTRDSAAGAAIDSRDFASHRLACPNCHLAVPRVMFLGSGLRRASRIRPPESADRA